jgi:hypothetical protein
MKEPRNRDKEPLRDEGTLKQGCKTQGSWSRIKEPRNPKTRLENPELLERYRRTKE